MTRPFPTEASTTPARPARTRSPSSHPLMSRPRVGYSATTRTQSDVELTSNAGLLMKKAAAQVQTEVDPHDGFALAGEGACLLVGEQAVAIASFDGLRTPRARRREACARDLSSDFLVTVELPEILFGRDDPHHLDAALGRLSISTSFIRPGASAASVRK